MLVANVHKSAVAREVIDAASVSLGHHLRNGSWREVKLILRLFACLQGLLDGEGVFGILDDLFSRAVDLQTASTEDVGYEIGGNKWA